MPKVLKHILIWTAYFVFVSATDYVLADFYINLPVQIAIYLTHNILLFYSFLYCYRSYDGRTPATRLLSVGRFAATIAVFLVARYCVTEFLCVRYFDQPDSTPLFWSTLAILWITRYGVIALAFHYFTSYSRKQGELQAMVDERHQQEQQKLSLEIKVLRAQIDPHFLYNALNALYAKALPVSEALGQAILKLANIMRYAINPNLGSKTALLNEEIEHLRNVVDFTRFRFNNKIFLELDTGADFSGIQTPPLAFITLAENVLKHGNLNDPKAPGRISFTWQDAGTLRFATWNRKRSSREFPSHGIGLNNTIQRLKDHYGNNCIINIEDGIDHFSVEVLVTRETVATMQDQNLGQVLRS